MVSVMITNNTNSCRGNHRQRTRNRKEGREVTCMYQKHFNSQRLYVCPVHLFQTSTGEVEGKIQKGDGLLN